MRELVSRKFAANSFVEKNKFAGFEQQFIYTKRRSDSVGGGRELHEHTTWQDFRRGTSPLSVRTCTQQPECSSTTPV